MVCMHVCIIAEYIVCGIVDFYTATYIACVLAGRSVLYMITDFTVLDTVNKGRHQSPEPAWFLHH